MDRVFSALIKQTSHDDITIIQYRLGKQEEGLINPIHNMFGSSRLFSALSASHTLSRDGRYSSAAYHYQEYRISEQVRAFRVVPRRLPNYLDFY